MSKLTIRFLGVAAFLCFPILTNAQTPITGFYPKKNKFTIATTYSNKSYDKFYRGKTLSDGNPANLGDISSSIISLYGEYGVNNWLSAVVAAPYISIKSDNGNPDPVHSQSRQSGLQDLSLFMKARFLEKKYNNGSKITLGGATGVTFPLGNYEGNGILSIGNKSTTIDGIVVAQYTTKINLFTEIQAGYSARSNSDFKIPNAFLYGFKVGYYNDWIYTHVKLGIQDSNSGYDIGSAEFGSNGGPVALSQTKVDYTNLSFDVYVPVYQQNIGISAGYGFNLSGRNFGKERGLSIGVVYKK